MIRTRFLRRAMPVWVVAGVFLAAGSLCAAEISVKKGKAASNISLKNEVRHAVKKGLSWLAKQQHPKGFWSSPDHPALSALALTAFMGEPTGEVKANPPDCVQKGYAYVLSCVRPDGGIYVKELANYNTSTCMMALLISGNPSHQPVIRKARNFVVGLQSDFDEKGKTDNVYDGGVGYGNRYPHSDMSNTTFALESLHYTRFLKHDVDEGVGETKELDWGAAIRFIERCQNLVGYNDQAWASNDPRNKGGFVYFPGNSKAGEMTLPSGKTALRSYGSISYAGLLSYIHADLDRDDPRVRAVLEWLEKNYTLTENPGMGLQGLYYYYHMMAKALSASGVDMLVVENGKTIDWRKDLTLQLLNFQNSDGFWVNENGRWWEKDPNLVTSYAVIALEIIYRGL